MNFLKETIDDIKDSGHSPDDIIFIGSEKSGHSCTWDDFCKLADNDYYNGFGGQSVAVDLIIVFSDGSTMWRGEYDGSEWWNYSKPFTMPEKLKKIKSLFPKESWSDLEDFN